MSVAYFTGLLAIHGTYEIAGRYMVDASHRSDIRTKNMFV